MGKGRELQRTAAVSGSPRRRQRVTAIKDSSDDDKQMELRTSVESSDEDYFEDDGTNQLPPGSSSLPKNRRGFRSATRSAAVIGGPIPRRTRSGKRLREYRNSGTGEDLRRQKSTLSPGMGSPIGSGGVSKKKKKKKYGASNSKPPSLVQDDIEIEVAEALFDLMTQSHSRPQASDRDGKVYGDGTNAVDDVELNRLQSELGKVDNPVFKVQNKETINANAERSIILFEPTNNKGAENDKLRDEQNGCDIQYPTMTKPDSAAIVVEPNNGKAPMELLSLPDIDPKVTTNDVQKKNETPKIGVIGVDDSSSQQPQGRKETHIQSPTPLSIPIGMGSRTTVFPPPGYTPSVGAGSSNIMKLPEYKPVLSGTKRCMTHRFIADSIYHHQQLSKSMLSASGKTMASTKRLPTGKDNASADGNALTDRPPLFQRASNQTPAHNLKSGFSLAPGQRQTTMMAPANSSFPVGSSAFPSLPSFKGGPSFQNSSFKGGPSMLNFPQIRRPPSHRGWVPPNNQTTFQRLPEVSWNGGNKAPDGKSHADPFLTSFYQHQLHQIQLQQQQLRGGASSSSLPRWDNIPRPASTAREGLFHQPRINSNLQIRSSQEQNRNITQSVAVSPLIVGEGSNASTGSASASQNGESNPACRRVVPPVLGTGANQLPEVRE